MTETLFKEVGYSPLGLISEKTSNINEMDWHALLPGLVKMEFHEGQKA